MCEIELCVVVECRDRAEHTRTLAAHTQHVRDVDVGLLRDGVRRCWSTVGEGREERD